MKLRLLRTLLALALALACQGAAAQEPGREQVRTELRFRDGVVTLTSDRQEKTGPKYRAQGGVRISYKDIVVSGDEAEYDEETSVGFVSGEAHFSQKDQWLSAARAEFDFAAETGVFHDATGYTDKEFLVRARTIRKTGADTFLIEDGFATACRDTVPKWSFSAARTEIRLDHTARMYDTMFRIKGVPVFYTPYLILPTEKKDRSSGFIPFHTGTSTSKGRLFSEGWYQTLGRSSDLLIQGDWFSLRGLALGGVFRTRPNADTHLELRLYGIDDKRGQGGLQIDADGETLLGDGWRAVVHANIYSNFAFRQAFADNLENATVPTEKALAFLTRNHGSISTNVSFSRNVVLFPDEPLITKKTPSLEFSSLGTPLGRSPFVLDFRAALDGISRSDSRINTGSLVQRLDVFPHISVRLPSLAGFSVTPTVGMRETWYGARLAPDSLSGVSNDGFHRRYLDLGVSVKTPVLERDFQSSRLGDFRHSVEPYFTYRKIEGVRDLGETIRFDENDAIADTNEIEYGIVNRFTRNGGSGAGGEGGRQEFMSLALVQRHYFDPTFGGAFEEGRVNSFYPLDSVTGFYQTGRMDNFSPLSAIFRLSPQSGIYNDIRADLDVKRRRWRNVSLSTLWEQGDFFLSGTYFILRPDEPGILSGNHIQGQIGYGSQIRGPFASLTASYNLTTGRWLNSETRLGYTWDCCSVGTEVNQYDLGLRTESRVSVSFTLKGIGNFGNVRGTRNTY
ncbi:MAG: LPS assembly protein LptD [Acidobacteriota bacterium]|nr:LPS assembly protein LptD [Acidobacteriota bacterium]